MQGIETVGFGAAHPHTAYLFANRRTSRINVLMHGGIGIWLAASQLNLMLGLPWHRISTEGSSIATAANLGNLHQDNDQF